MHPKIRHSTGQDWQNLCARLAAAALMLSGAVNAEERRDERSGKDVVQAICSACHATGKEGAPKIGDKQAWGKLAARGLTSLTDSALTGIRKMPAHGGSPDATDLDISRAISYMVNQSGGHWIEPIAKSASLAATTARERSGRQIVEMQCSKCHLTGESGAPKIGDRETWVQRLKRGMDDVVRSAFNGHGPMPPRGGVDDINVSEMRGAITYMFNPGSANLMAPAIEPPRRQDANHRIVGNTEVFFGITSAESIRDAQKNQAVASITSIPAGNHFFHVNVALRDRTSNLPVTNAKVDVRVEDSLSRRESKTLDVMAINRSISYGGFFHFPTKGHYAISVKIGRTDSPQVADVRFEFERN